MEPVASSRDRRVLVFRVAGEQLALPASEVAEVIRPPRLTRVPMSPPGLAGVANLRGTVLPVVSLGRVLGTGTGTPAANARVIVVDTGGLVGLASLLGGTQDNGSCRPWNGQEWIQPYGDDGFQCAVHPQDNKILYATKQQSRYGLSDDFGESIVSVDPPPLGADETPPFITPLAVDPNDGNRILGAAERVYRGLRMAGHMGDERVTIKNVRVVRADVERNLLLVSGSLPGSRGSLVLVRKA